MSRWGYKDQEKLLSIAGRLREQDIAVGVMHLDPLWLTEKNGHTCPFEWDATAFGDPENMVKEVTSLDMRRRRPNTVPVSATRPLSANHIAIPAGRLAPVA
ncbi:MAG: TIM-barrel domain-containing protein [Sulfobacillus sp.]